MTAIPVLSIEPEFQSTRTARHVLSVIVRDPLSLMSTIVILLFILIAIFAYQVAPYPLEGAGKTNVSHSMLAPSPGHPFGADRLGRDMLSRVIMGARPALIVPIGVVLFAVLIGAPLGAIAGYKGGWVDEAIMRFTDLFLAFPSLLLAMAIASALGRGLQNAAIALVVSWWPWYTRLVRGVTISLPRALLHRSRPGYRRARFGHHPAPYPAEYHLPHPGPGHCRPGYGHPGYGRSGLSRFGHAAADARLGLDGQRRTRVHPETVVDFHLPRSVYFYRRAGFQFARRYAARYLRSEAVQMTLP